MHRNGALRRLILALLLTSALQIVRAQDAQPLSSPLFTGAPHDIPYQDYDLEHLRLALRVELDAGRIYGVATYRIRHVEDSLPAIVLRARDIEVFSVRAGTLDGEKFASTYTFEGADSLVVSLDSLSAVREPIEVQVTYAATPASGMYIHRPATSRDAALVWTDAAPESQQFWLPLPFSPSDLLTSEVLISVPPDMEALSNGQLTETMPTEDGLVLFHYVQDQQHAPYAIGLVVGRFFKYEQSVRLYNGFTVPFAQWVPEERTDEVARTFQETGSILNFLSARFGTVYPWPRYTQVLANDLLIDQFDFTGFTLFNDRFLLDERAALDESPVLALATALAHQWVGAMLPPDFWSESWMASGLSTYIGLLYVREREGDEAFYAGLSRLADAYFAEAAQYRRPLVWNEWRHPVDMLDAHSRAKAAWIFHAIHQQLGDDAFWGLLEAFRRARAFTPVNSDQLKQSLSTWSKTSYDRFFDQWVYSAGHPELNVSYRYDAVAESLYVDLRQVQEGYLVPGVFDLNLDFEIHSLGSSQRFSYALRKNAARVAFPLSLAPRFVLVDPDHRYLMKTRVDQNLTAWVAQLRYAPNVLDRLAAVEALGAWKNDPALGIGLQSVVQTQPPETVYTAVVSLLTTLPPSESTDRLLLNAFEGGSPRIQRIVLEGLSGRDQTADVTIMALETAETAMSYVLQASAVSVLARVKAPSAEGIVRSALITPSHRERVRLAGLGAIPIVGISTREGVQLATSYTAAHHPTELRLGALRLLTYYAGMGNKSALSALDGLTEDTSPLVRRAAILASGAVRQDTDPDVPIETLLSLPYLRQTVRQFD
ncbi:MAG: M1 family aminopeptidase [Rhodothermales bacterium]